MPHHRTPLHGAGTRAGRSPRGRSSMRDAEYDAELRAVRKRVQRSAPARVAVAAGAPGDREHAVSLVVVGAGDHDVSALEQGAPGALVRLAGHHADAVALISPDLA